MNISKHLPCAAAAALLTLAGTAQASLISQGDGTVLDTATNLIWLQDWNVNGQANWSAQTAWAANLTFAGSSDWALPEISEYAALFNAYGDLTEVTEFTNVQSEFYWSDTEFVAGLNSRIFFPVTGYQSTASQSNALFAVAVRPADVTGSVPEPQTLALVLLASGAGLVASRRRSR